MDSRSYLVHVLLRGKLCPTTEKGDFKKKKKSERESLNYHNFPKHETQVTFNLSTGQKKRKEKTKQNSNKNITFLLFVKFSQR